MSEEPTFWKKCSSCKKEIGFSTKYYLCSVSTCRHSRKGFTFCSPTCWSEHLGFANHRDAWAEDYHSPTKVEFMENENAGKPKGRRIIVDKHGEDGSPSPTTTAASQIKTDTLVVVSKVKKLIKEQSGFNTSQCCVEALTQKVVEECLKAISNAKRSDRKTVMGRDVT